jgi:hypothetical protein
MFMSFAIKQMTLELEPIRTDRLKKSTGPVETRISPFESFAKPSVLLTLFEGIKTKMPHNFLV